MAIKFLQRILASIDPAMLVTLRTAIAFADYEVFVN